MSASKSGSQGKLPRPRALLFDWDSTLVDNWTAIHAAMNVTLGHFRQETWTVEQCKARVKTSLRDAFPRLFAGQSELALQTYLDAYERIHLQHLAEMPAAGAMLDAAQEIGLYLGIVSNKTGPNLRQEVEHLGWTPRFSRIVGATDAPRDKPAPDPVHLALGESGVSPGPDVWFIGDTDIDMLCARNSGCTGVLLNLEAPSQEIAAAGPAHHVPDCAGFARLLTTVCLSGSIVVV
jgi:phosphoglycolate phosphatase